MASAINPITHPDAYDTFRIGPATWTGKVEVVGAADLREWEKVKGQGTAGATTKYAGEGLAEFGVRFYCWEPEHFDAFERDVRPQLAKPKANVKPKAVEVDYPELAKIGVRRVVVVQVGTLEIADDSGLYFYLVSFMQFRPPKPIQVLKAKQEGGPEDKGKPEKPLEPRDVLIQELTRQLKEEANK